MYVTRLLTSDFRNLENEEIFPCRGVNVIYGDNAQGKTNLLEALWLFTGGHSFRGAKDSELPRLDAESGRNLPSTELTLDFFSEEREQRAVLRIDNGRRSSVINGVKKKTGSALIGKLRAVIFSPEHLLLVKEGPSRRRNFADGAICQIRPGFAGAISMYNRALLQRNTLLKDITRFPEFRDTLEVWDDRLAHFGTLIMRERRNYIEKLFPKAAEIYRGISKGRESMEITYSPILKVDVENPDETQWKDEFLRELKRTVSSDIRAGFTSAGPHRDDIDISLNGLSVRAYGSQGQQRSVVLALKLAEAELLAELSGEQPIVLLDDVMSELDRSRQDYLLNHLHGRQVFITCCDPGTVDMQETGRRFKLSAGKTQTEEL